MMGRYQKIQKNIAKKKAVKIEKDLKNMELISSLIDDRVYIMGDGALEGVAMNGANWKSYFSMYK